MGPREICFRAKSQLNGDPDDREKFTPTGGGVLFSFGGRFDYLTIAMNGSFAVAFHPILKPRTSHQRNSHDPLGVRSNFQIPSGDATWRRAASRCKVRKGRGDRNGEKRQRHEHIVKERCAPGSFRTRARIHRIDPARACGGHTECVHNISLCSSHRSAVFSWPTGRLIGPCLLGFSSSASLHRAGLRRLMN